ncbi:glycoside hydrolase family 66 protein [Gorillibacterium timonense]|uniref:glycoside hydrolase family 66 protein n=1 Tax=Gorillibacterium timonense TaxID=1689269 RepID=UPI00071D7502|nr:glycoside hydrolase family 66 protein [Gorillibacterium timonense]
MNMRKWGMRTAACTGAACLLLVAAGCKEEAVRIETVPDGELIKSVATDKAAYKPGEPVKYEAVLNGNVGSRGKLLIRYKHLNEVVKEQTVSVSGEKAAWEWTPPSDNYKGYLTELLLKQDGKWTDRATIAVDVSGDWSKYPRYGYLADFHKLDEGEMQRTVDRLNRFHINGVQFYDWQYKHQTPIKWEGDKPASTWPDIANREVSFDTVKGYIDLLHGKSMKAMNYNLLFGAYQDAEKDGVKKEWGMFKDPLLQNQDRHPLPDSWASDIYLYNPGNLDWQNYLFAAEKKTFDTLPFDGWHVDQLGDRGALWDGKGKSFNLALTYKDFLANAKEKLGKEIVINAVGQYGQALIAKAPVQFLYTELWESYPEYKSLKQAIDENNKYGSSKLATVLAAYMNYKHADSKGEFNAPGVLLTNATIFASGGSHLEQGENMLAKEYFPNRNLTIPEALENQLIAYYDFLTAYENLLRDPSEEIKLAVTAGSELPISDTPKKGSVWSLAKQQANRAIVQLVNFTDATTMNWNDTDATQAEPKVRENVQLTIPSSEKVKAVWTASPDIHHGAPVALDFKQENGQLSITLPELKYWDMVVLEYKGDSK